MAATAKENPILHHVTFKTLRLQEMVDWYAKVVGARVNFQFEGAAWTTNDEANHRVAFLKAPGLENDPDQIKHVGIHHTAFEFSELPVLLNHFVDLEKEGILPQLCLNHGLTMSFYYVDPDGNMVELQVDNFGDWEVSTEFMKSSAAFQANPIGVEVDPPQMVKAMKEGVSSKDIQKRSYEGAYPPAKQGDMRMPHVEEEADRKEWALQEN